MTRFYELLEGDLTSCVIGFKGDLLGFQVVLSREWAGSANPGNHRLWLVSLAQPTTTLLLSGVYAGTILGGAQWGVTKPGC